MHATFGAGVVEDETCSLVLLWISFCFRGILVHVCGVRSDDVFRNKTTTTMDNRKRGDLIIISMYNLVVVL